jgi:ribosomal protein L20A (L18A)
VQPPLVPLTEEEKASAPGRLAEAVKELEALEDSHKKVAAEHRAERKQVKGRIAALAGQILMGGR